MELSELSSYLQQVEETNSRIEKQDIVWDALEDVRDSKAEDYQKREGEALILALTTCERFNDNGVAKKTIRKAALNVTGETKDSLRALESDTGSLPDAVQRAADRTERITPREPISVSDLWDELIAIEEASGGTMETRIEMLLADYHEPKWLTHALLGKKGVSLGFGVKTAAKMIQRYHRGISKNDIVKARALCPDIIELNQRAPDVPTTPEVGTPFLPMLASSEDMPEDPDIGGWSIQPKFDGARVLVHYDRGKIQAFSRNTNEVTESLPELADVADALPDGGRFILDGEAVAYDEDGNPGTSQQAMTRFNRKHDVAGQDFDMKFFFFDVVYVGGGEYDDVLQTEAIELPLGGTVATPGDLSDAPFYERDNLLRKLVGRDGMYTHTDTALTQENAKRLFHDFVDDGWEGAILKREDSVIDYDKRSHDWRKLKFEQENVDLRIAEVIEGEDSRAGKMGALVLETSDGYPICKVGTGFTEEDEAWFWQNREDVVGEVAEIKWQELSVNVDGEYSIRFPVFVHLRDKLEADSLERVRNIAQ